MKYLLLDMANLYFRMRFVASKKSDSLEKVGYALHLTLSSSNQMVNKFNIDHVVVCLEGRSWRKDFYKPYKANRVVDEAGLTKAEIEENKLFWETYQSLIDYFTTKTNCSVIRCPVAEADDVIARFIHLHPNDEIIINSSDGDYDQLISPKVSRYNGITAEMTTIDGIFNEKGKPVIDKKTKLPKKIGDPEFVIFEHAIRGDTSDNIFSAYPGVRMNGTKNKVGILEAYNDRDKKGFAWNNFLLQRWTDHNGVEHRVKDDYERNLALVSLSAQPDNIKIAVDASIMTSLRTQPISQVGTHFLKFCGKYELQKISESAATYSKWLAAPYVGHLSGIAQ